MIFRKKFFFSLPTTALVSACLVSTVCGSTSNQALTTAEQIEQAFIAAVEKVRPATVLVSSQRTPTRVGVSFTIQEDGREGGGRVQPLPPEQLSPETQVGAGVILRQDGYIITNAHVVSVFESIRVTLDDGREFDAEVVGWDDASDLAVLKIPVNGLPLPALSEQPTRVGQWALALGAPYNLENSFAAGWISATERRGMVMGQIVDYIQITTPLHPGNSGGPLFDIHGKIIGINTMVRGLNTGLGFAIPAAEAWKIGAQIIRDGFIQRPWLGIRVLDIRENPSLLQNFYPANTRGVLVETVEPGGPASGEDVLPFDVIQSVDARSVGNPAELIAEIGRREIGDKVRLGILRARHRQPLQRLTVTVTLSGIGERADKAGDKDDEKAQAAVTHDLLGLVISETPVTDTNMPPGVRVEKADEKSQLYCMGLTDGCVIHFINLQPTPDAESYKKSLESAAATDNIHVIFSCNGTKSFALVSKDR
jgi:serine protease Do